MFTKSVRPLLGKAARACVWLCLLGGAFSLGAAPAFEPGGARLLAGNSVPLNTVPLDIATGALSATAMPLEQAWQEKPVLGTLLGNSARRSEVVERLGLSPQEAKRLQKLVLDEQEAIRDLLELSRPIVSADVPDEEKQTALEALDYNGRCAALARTSSQALQTLLGPEGWNNFLVWARAAWRQDSQRGGMARVTVDGTTYETYTVYATQYDAYTTYEVAVPDKYVKFAAQGTEYHTGYPQGLNYKVTMTRGTVTYTERVYEVGPWNVDDNYWNAANDPERPRRKFTDLPQGMPEAQAAYYDDYNNGLDQYGRTVLNPGGLDLSIETASKMGLAYLENVWITTQYLWEPVQTVSTGNLLGYVREDDIYAGTPIVATVTLNNGARATTNEDGLYRFDGLEAGAYTINATAECYLADPITRTVTAGADTWGSIAMTYDPSCEEEPPACTGGSGLMPTGRGSMPLGAGVAPLLGLLGLGMIRLRRTGRG